MRFTLLESFSCLFLLSLSAQTVPAALEPWTDPRLPVRDGLEFWLDVSRQNAARQAQLLPGLLDKNPVDLAFDGSGNHFHLSQRAPDARPQMKVSGSGAWFRFDGKDDSLAVTRLARTLTNCTIFVVAAPHSNNGFFRALLALNAAGRNDYTSGLTIDLGAAGSASFSFLNIEGAGFGGVRNLLTNSYPFGAFHRFTVSSSAVDREVRLAVDGLPQASRPRTSPSISMQELTVGARCFSNTSEPPHTQGQFDGDIAEILVFNRTVTLAEWKSIDTYLAAKYAGLRSPNENIPGGPRPLQVVDSPPPVQMFVPGFTARELPLKLRNLNNVKYRPDGKVVALGYDGHI